MEYKFSIFFAATIANTKDDTTIDSLGLLYPYSDYLFTVQEIPVLQPGNLTLSNSLPYCSCLNYETGFDHCCCRLCDLIRSNLIGQWSDRQLWDNFKQCRLLCDYFVASDTDFLSYLHPADHECQYDSPHLICDVVTSAVSSL